MSENNITSEPNAWEFGSNLTGLLRVEKRDQNNWPPVNFKFYWHIEFHGSHLSGLGDSRADNSYQTFEAARDAGLEVLALCAAIQIKAGLRRLYEVSDEQ